MQHMEDAGVRPWVRITSPAEPIHGYEITYWRTKSNEDQPGRTLLFVCQNPEITGTSEGGGNSTGLWADIQTVELTFQNPIRNVRDERLRQSLPDGRKFDFRWKQTEAIVLSFTE